MSKSKSTPSRLNIIPPDEADELAHVCAECGGPLQLVRPGKWQCPRAPHRPPDSTEALPVSPELAALFAAHGIDKVKPAREPGEFTAKDYAAFRGVTPATASNELLSLVEAGRATRRLVLRAFIYKFVE